jgi:hypothetical protein
MGPFNAAWEEEQRRRRQRHDAHLWIATDPERFGPLDPEVKRILDEQFEFKHGHASAQRRPRDSAAQVERDAQERALIERIRIENEVLRDEVLAIKATLVAAKANFNPAQPRDEVGRWTDTGAATRPINDPHVISDATPENDWKPGAQYAQAPSGGTRRGGPRKPIEPGQAARLAVI